LAYIKRYSNVPKIHEESVAEHGFFVAAIVGDLYREYKFNLGLALIIAISHDMTEIELNDCPHIIKKKYPEIAGAYEVSEHEVRKQLPPVWAFGSSIFDEGLSIVAKIVLLADVIQCIQFSELEVKLGNEGYMREVYVNSRSRERKLRKELENVKRSGRN